jgi:hypothetical protein
MTEQHQARALFSTRRDALSQPEGALEHTREGVDAITSQVACLRQGLAALGALRQREVPAVGGDMVVDAAAEFLAAFRELETGILDAQGDVDLLEAALAEDEDGRDA